MSFLSSQSVEDVNQTDRIIKPFNADHLEQGAYELSLGSEAYLTTDETKTRLSRNHPTRQICIEPGQFAMLLSKEEVRMPNHLIGFISIRSRYKKRGLINVSGFHVDPGYEGKLKFSVFNAGAQAITISKDERIFPIWFAKLDHPERKPYVNSNSGQNHITSQDVNNLRGKLSSPSENRRALDQLERDLNLVKVLIASLISIVVAAIITLSG